MKSRLLSIFVCMLMLPVLAVAQAAVGLPKKVHDFASFLMLLILSSAPSMLSIPVTSLYV